MGQSWAVHWEYHGLTMVYLSQVDKMAETLNTRKMITVDEPRRTTGLYVLITWYIWLFLSLSLSLSFVFVYIYIYTFILRPLGISSFVYRIYIYINICFFFFVPIITKCVLPCNRLTCQCSPTSDPWALGIARMVNKKELQRQKAAKSGCASGSLTRTDHVNWRGGQKHRIQGVEESTIWRFPKLGVPPKMVCLSAKIH